MRYLLAVGFACDTFKKPPRARIIINQKLIDEFDISNYFDNLTNVRNELIKNWLTSSFVDNDQKVLKSLPPIKFYEISIDKKLNELNFEIKIQNNDSNYCNGFLTGSTKLKLQICHFFPLDRNVLERLHMIKQKNCFSENYAWYCSFKQRIFDLGANGICWQGENGQKIENKTHTKLAAYNIGGNGKFFIELIKKYNIFMPRLKFPCRHTFSKYLIDHLLDKYLEYENK